MKSYKKTHRIAQARLNQRNAERNLIKLIRNNFTENDVALTLTYKLSPKNVEEAQHTLTNFLRRIKRLRAKIGLEPLKYISVTEARKRNGRIRHYVIMNVGVDGDVIKKLWALGFIDVIKKLWRVGFVDVQRLQFGENETGLATYFIKDRKTFRRWNSSRNLIFPHYSINKDK